MRRSTPPAILVAILAAMLVALAGMGSAQETTGNVRGRVLALGAPVAGARIVATGASMLGDRRATSASDGVYTLLALPPGTYTLRITAIGVRPVSVEQVRVTLGRTTGLADVAFEPAAVALDPMKIAAQRVTLDPVRTTIGATLEAEEIAALPGDRDYKSLIAIVPQINTSYLGDPPNAAGSTGLENMYFIDGVNVTSPLRASSGTSLPFNFIKSIQVRAGGYEAQYGRALGAIVNAVTYTGSNTLESDVFGFFTSSALSASALPVPGLRDASTRSFDAGARLSGPVVRDRLWFSVAYNPRVEHADRELTGLGVHADDRLANIFAGKLTWRADESTNVELSVTGDPTVQHSVAPISWEPGLTLLNADPYLTRLETGGVSTALRATRSVGTSLLLEASVGLAASRDNASAETMRGLHDAFYVDHAASTLSGGSWGHSFVSERRVTGLVRATLSASAHTLLAGVEYDDSHVTSAFGSAVLDGYASDNYTLTTQSINGTFTNRAPTFYLQDSWRATNRLTLNAGVRWESQSLIGTAGTTAQKFADEWQPRVGFSYGIDASGTERVFGSFGRYYQQEPLLLSTLYYADYFGNSISYTADPRRGGSRPDSSIFDFSVPASAFSHSIAGASAERFDEFTLGYERVVTRSALLTLRAVHRHLGTSFVQGADPTRAQYWFLGTPGKGDLAYLAAPKRDYDAFELAVTGDWRDVHYRASYVLSRTWGNYPGLYDSDVYLGDPGLNYIMMSASQVKNSTGLLPNDRTHVLKVSATTHLTKSLLAGAFVTAESGTPLNDFGVATECPNGCGSGRPLFLAQRGSRGRAPALIDANLRLTYSAPATRGAVPTFVLDLLHIGNQQTAVRIDQQHYTATDDKGNQVMPNATFRQPLAFLPPMSARLGIEVKF